MEIDLSRLPAATRQKMDEIFRQDWDLKVLQAIAAQQRTARVHQNGVPWSDDFGPQRNSINPVIDSLWRQVYGHNYTEDLDKLRFLEKRNEEIKVRAHSGKIQVGYEAKHQTPKPKHQTLRFRPSKTGCRFGRGTLSLTK